MTGNNPDTELAELESIRAKRQALAEAREARALPTVGESLALEKRALADDEALDRLEQEHGRIGTVIQIVRSNVGGVIVRRPHMAVFRRFQDEGKRDMEAIDRLVRPCVLYPSKPEFDRMCEELPFLMQLVADAVVTLAGVRIDDVKAKR